MLKKKTRMCVCVCVCLCRCVVHLGVLLCWWVCMRACGPTASDLWEKVSDCMPSLQPIVFHPFQNTFLPPPPSRLSVPCCYSAFDAVSFLVQQLLRAAISQLFVSAFSRSIPLAKMLTIERRCGDHQRTLSSRQLFVTE